MPKGFTQKQKQTALTRDNNQCVPHAGTCHGTLVIHHRANRGMGGRPSANTLPNALTVCTDYNTAMETNPHLANQARKYGYKLPTTTNPQQHPVYYPLENAWYTLEHDGTRKPTTNPTP